MLVWCFGIKSKNSLQNVKTMDFFTVFYYYTTYCSTCKIKIKGEILKDTFEHTLNVVDRSQNDIDEYILFF